MSETETSAGWLTRAELRDARERLPIVYVSVVPVRVDERGVVTTIGLLLRASSEGTIDRELVSGRVLYHQKQVDIDYFPWVFTKRQWKNRLKKFYEIQKMMHHLAKNEEALESNYWLLRGEWKHLAQEMGFWRYHLAFLRSMFSIHRITMWRLIKWGIPKEAGPQ